MDNQSYKCRGCGATYSMGAIQNGLLFCEYCGAKIEYHKSIKENASILNPFLRQQSARKREKQQQMLEALNQQIKEQAPRIEKSINNSLPFFKQRLLIYGIVGIVSILISLLVGLETVFGMVMAYLAGTAVCLIYYGCIVHGLILLINRNRKKRLQKKLAKYQRASK